MKQLTTLRLAVLLLAASSVARAAELVVYPPVPGLAASEYYQVRVRDAADGSEWQSAFAVETTCKAAANLKERYLDNLRLRHADGSTTPIWTSGKDTGTSKFNANELFKDLQVRAVDGGKVNKLSIRAE